jgi:hypothetical protein
MSLLAGVCDFAQSYNHQLPDYICEQTTTRSESQATTVLKAQVTFEKGHERYSNVTVNGKPVDAVSSSDSTIKFISSGELGSNLVNLFNPATVAEFKFRGEDNLSGSLSSVFHFHIAAGKNTFWALRNSRGSTVRPEYEGEVWVDRQSGRLLRLHLRPLHLPEWFGFSRAEIVIDYSMVAIAELGTFLLPSGSDTTVCVNVPRSRVPSCTKNALVFDHCRKFSVKTRIKVRDQQQQ